MYGHLVIVGPFGPTRGKKVQKIPEYRFWLQLWTCFYPPLIPGLFLVFRDCRLMLDTRQRLVDLEKNTRIILDAITLPVVIQYRK